ncbi:unnamed protein product [Clonostachys rosea]|uniref:Nuclear pore protein n=1 Tax=Bionectria ochroleuca TaxID=29856 RepID=A0ABY6UUP6_BIOOC|nr:unnamed protein product [Clonostachys rosea]
MSLFGQPATGTGFGQSTTGATGGGLFGQNKPALGGSLFGQPQQTQAQTQPAAGTGTGLFGQPAQQSQPQQQTGTMGSSLFGGNNAATQQNTTGGGLFGAAAQNQQPQKPSLFGGASMNLSGSTLLGAPSISTATPAIQQPQQVNQPLLGTSLLASQAPGGLSQTQSATQNQPAGAYFDSLLAKSQKGGETKSNMGDLPSLELGLGDLRHRLRKLQSKPSDRPLDGKAHYLLAASGVDPGAAAKDLGLLDVQGGRADRATHAGYAPSEVDVETYLSNLQTKTTLSMIADGLERSVRDFDNFLEDNVTMEWDAQRKRIYEHFGIKPREEAAPGARETQGAFGRSRRSKSQAGMSKAGRSSMLGKSLGRSVIGAPTRIGPHQSEFSDVERSSSDKSKGPGRPIDDKVQRERQARLADKVRNLNASRIMKRPYPIISELAEVERKSVEPHAVHVHEAYLALSEIVGENRDAETTLNNETAKEREYADIYLNDNPNSPQSLAMRKRILEGSSRFLEIQFLREVEALIAKHPHEAKLGGLPDIQSKIRAYIRLRSARKDLVPDDSSLIVVGGEPIWAVVFYLLRSGQVEEAARYINDNGGAFKSTDRTFSTYMNNYAASDDRRITSKKLLDRCRNELNSRIKLDSTLDPYRRACYQIIGRAELSNRSLEGLNTDINDWIWLQFTLAREGDKTIEMAGESYGLVELQASIREIGQKHFPKNPSDDNNGSFGMLFYLQVLAGLFEDALAYLYPFSYIDAVHFGIALEFYGLLRPSDAMLESNDLRSYSTKNLPQINFGRMIGYYTRDFRAADVESAVDYLTLICLNQDLGGEAGRRHGSLCHEALRDLVLETREFSLLIGDIRPDGRRIKGIIEERGPLIGLDVEDDFVNTVTLQAASFADENGRTTDSVLLYHLAGEYDTVVAIVSRALSEAISLDIGEDPMRLMPVKPRAGPSAENLQGSSLSLAAIDDPVELAKTMMSIYEKNAMFYPKIQDQSKVACGVLLEMSNIKSLVEASQWAPALDKIRGLQILPLEANGDASTIRAYASKFSGLPQPVSINVPNLLMWTVVCCVRQREQLSNGQFSGNEGTRRLMVEQLKQITLDLTTYTSQLRYRFPPHLHEALARASAE